MLRAETQAGLGAMTVAPRPTPPSPLVGAHICTFDSGAWHHALHHMHLTLMACEVGLTVTGS